MALLSASITPTNLVTTSGTATLTNKTFSDNPTFSGGTANGVPYLNGSKVLTTGSALVFDGTNLGVGTSSPAAPLNVQKTGAGSVTSILLSRTTENAADQQSILWKSNDLSLDYAAIAGVIDSGTAGSMQFKTATGGTLATKATLDSAGNLGIGTSSPSAKLEVADGTVFASGANRGMRFGESNCSILGDSATASAANLVFYTGNAERLRIPAAGGVQAVTTISVGNATPSASGAGITFPATQSASSDANTLDDYEEGTWTPTYSDWVTSPTSAEAIYIKIGKLVYVMVTVAGSNMQTTAGASQIIGLPFTPSGISNASRGSGSVTNGTPNINGSILIYSNGSLYFATSFSSQSVMTITAMYQTTS